MAKKQVIPSAPEPRDLGKELAMISQAAAASAQAQAQAQGTLNQQMLDQNLAATERIAQRLDNDYTAAARGQLAGVAGDVRRMRGLGDIAAGDVQGTEIERMLQQQAEEELGLGRALSAEQVRESQQAARGAFGARGMLYGSGAALAEVLNRDAYGTARQDARRGFAGQVNQMVAGNRVNRLNTAGSLYGNAGQMGMGLAQGYVGLDPFQRALGSNLALGTQANSSGLVGNAFGQTAQYGQDLFNTNYNAAWSQRNSALNNNAALQGAATSAAGAKAGGDSALMGSGIAAGGAILGVAAIAF